MTENYDNYISKSIKSVYKRKLIAPFIYIILLAVIWFALSLSEVLFPEQIAGYPQVEEHYENGSSYIQVELTDLYFTGYTNTALGKTNGYYYYTMLEDRCIFVLLSPGTSEEGLPHIERVQIHAKIIYQGSAYQQLSDSLAQDLSWTAAGLTGQVSPYILSEPAFHPMLTALLMVIYFATALYALISVVIAALYILFPVLSPPCRQLGRFGKASKLLAQAEEELATLPQLATEDMFITEHFFIELADSGIAIVPIQKIIWIYKYSTLHKFFWYHFNISYTLHITADRHWYIRCPKNMKSDIDGIIDYLTEANHNILVGFNEENRLKVQELQNPKIKFEKIIGFLKRRL